MMIQTLKKLDTPWASAIGDLSIAILTVGIRTFARNILELLRADVQRVLGMMDIKVAMAVRLHGASLLVLFVSTRCLNSRFLAVLPLFSASPTPICNILRQMKH